MTESRLIQATLLALTRQNVTQRIAPLSTDVMSATCINRDIAAGETVVCYYNDSGEVTRLGDVPSHENGSFFIDTKSRMYYQSGNTVVTQDGLTGTVISSMSADKFRVSQSCAVARVGQYPSVYRVIYPDGDISDEITVASEQNLRFRYANGVLAISYGAYDYTIETHTKSGALVKTLTTSAPTPGLIVPLSYDTVALGSHPFLGYGQLSRYTLVTDGSMSTYNPFEGYSVLYNSGGVTELTSFIGYDQTYMYAKGQLTNPEDITQKLDEWIIVKWAYASWTEAEVVIDSTDTEPLFSSMTDMGTVVYQEKTGEDYSTPILMDITTISPLYADDIPSVPQDAYLQENLGYIWIEGLGVYQKTAIGWLMYATAEYPRGTLAQTGICGYAASNVPLGKIGTAIVLFE